MLERKLGIRTDAKRKKRYLQRIEEEGLGLGIFDFLDDIERKAKIDVTKYSKPEKEYKFNDPKYEVALGESDIEEEAAKAKNGKKVAKKDDSDESDDFQEGFEPDDSENDASEGDRDFKRPSLIRDEEDEDEYGSEDGEDEMEEEYGEEESSKDVHAAGPAISGSESSIEDDMSAQGSYGDEFPVPEQFKQSKDKKQKQK